MQEYPWQQMQEHAFDVADGGTLRVRVDDADVAVVAAAGGNAAVDIRLRSNDMDRARDLFERTGYSARQEGDTIIVESGKQPDRDWRGDFWMSVVVEATVPTRFDLDLKTEDGDVSLASHEGGVHVDTQDGDIVAGELVGTTIELRTQDGDISATTLRAETIEAISDDGDISIDSLAGAVIMSTEDGDIIIGAATAPELSLDSGDGDIHVEIAGVSRADLATGDGDISIVAPPSLRASIDLSGNDVRIQGGFRVDGDVRDGRVQGDLNGGGERIRARAGDGTVRLVEGSNG